MISQQLLNVISAVEIVTLREFAELRPCSLDVIENSSIVSRPHYSFDAFSTVHTKMLENDRFARCDALVEFYAHATKTRDCAIFGHRVPFDAFSTAYTNSICMRFVFYSLSRAFSMQMLSVLLWTEGLNASKCMLFQTKTHLPVWTTYRP